ncbi:hypothetical protein [Streptomyces sp. NPDC046909]|uniref:hypothetical protein n=1 Tax=Streptomyces sp. NPDC046909 TaxID=3155617 RepID=UPI00340F9334
MADNADNNEWLNAETAERLLRGESLDNAVEPAARDEAERLAKTLGALTTDPPPNGVELPGEAAALAAFRKVRADRAPATTTAFGATARTSGAAATPSSAASGAPSTASGTTHPAPGADERFSDAGLIRIGAPDHRAPGRHTPGHRASRSLRPRRGRPVRLGLAAALALGMAGGVAVAAGTGILPSPFGDGEPGPNASVSAAVTPDRPLSSPSPSGGAEGEPTPDGSADPGASREDAGKDPSANPSTNPGSGTADKDKGYGSWWSGALSSCRDLRDGKQLSADRRRALDGFAGGSSQVWKYCHEILANTDPNTEGRPSQGDDRQGQGDDQDGKGDKDGKGGDDESHPGAPGRGNDHRRNGGFTTPSPLPEPSSSEAASLLPRHAATAPDPSPSPTYSAL